MYCLSLRTLFQNRSSSAKSRDSEQQTSANNFFSLYIPNPSPLRTQNTNWITQIRIPDITHPAAQEIQDGIQVIYCLCNCLVIRSLDIEYSDVFSNEIRDGDFHFLKFSAKWNSFKFINCKWEVGNLINMHITLYREAGILAVRRTLPMRPIPSKQCLFRSQMLSAPPAKIHDWLRFDLCCSEELWWFPSERGEA